ncbi:MAG: CocE/NonD family hydrolase [Flavobacteriales bacterium]|nr:CocE/NonD family hydrolase [Flavobacteriales bacterium]
MKKAISLSIFFLLIIVDTSFGQTNYLKRKHFDYTSFYHINREGIPLAVDLFLPKKHRLKKEGNKVPTVFYLTRYVRSIELKKGVKWLQNPGFGQVKKEEVDFFTKNGYAVVILDARGSGASFGNRMMDFTMDEMYDGAEVIDWIVKQPWSNGNVGTTGISYLGTTAELILATQHPAIKASIPRSNIYDLYADMAFPGGVRQGPFVKVWGITTRSLDFNDFTFLGGLAKTFVKGINPVLQDKNKEQLILALKDHQSNYEVYKELLKIEYRDEQHPVLKKPINDFSIHFNQQRIIESKTPIFRIGGWYDGALPNSVIRGLWNNPNTKRVLLGPWDHGPHDNASPYAKSPKVKYDIYGEMLRFFDFYLKNKSNGIDKELPVKYYTVGEERWKTSTTWPEFNSYKRLYFSSDKVMHFDSSKVISGQVEYTIDYTAETGPGTRWNSQTTIYRYAKHTGYPEREKQIKKNVVFITSPLENDIEINGHIYISLPLKIDATDGQVFIYIDEMDQKGNIRYVTEGMFRLTHQPISVIDNEYKTPEINISYTKHNRRVIIPGKTEVYNFPLLPISYKVKKGHQLIVSIAGADYTHFDHTEVKPEKLILDINDYKKAYIQLPIK